MGSQIKTKITIAISLLVLLFITSISAEKDHPSQSIQVFYCTDCKGCNDCGSYDNSSIVNDKHLILINSDGFFNFIKNFQGSATKEFIRNTVGCSRFDKQRKLQL